MPKLKTHTGAKKRVKVTKNGKVCLLYTSVRVVDYKSGSKVFRLDDVYYGLNLQMLIYLFTIWKNGTGRLEDALPAGVLYLPARDHIINTSRNASDQQVEQEHTKKYKMNGLVLEDPVCVYGMEQKAAGVFIPVKVKDSGGFDARSSLATLEQMGPVSYTHLDVYKRQPRQSGEKRSLRCRS